MATVPGRVDAPCGLDEDALAAPLTSRERRAAARAEWRASLAAGDPISGAELGRRFGLSDRWGRARVAEARNQGQWPTVSVAPVPTAAPAGGGTSDCADGRAPACGAGGATPVPAAVRRTTTVAVLAVALAAAASSYDHLRVLADVAGEGWRALLLPVSVDGLIVAASMSMLVSRRAGEPTAPLAWVALVLGLGASLAGNVVAADPSLVDPLLVKRVVAAWPPVALAIAYELFLGLRPDSASERGPGPGLGDVAS